MMECGSEHEGDKEQRERGCAIVLNQGADGRRAVEQVHDHAPPGPAGTAGGSWHVPAPTSSVGGVGTPRGADISDGYSGTGQWSSWSLRHAAVICNTRIGMGRQSG